MSHTVSAFGGIAGDGVRDFCIPDIAKGGVDIVTWRFTDGWMEIPQLHIDRDVNMMHSQVIYTSFSAFNIIIYSQVGCSDASPVPERSKMRDDAL